MHTNSLQQQVALCARVRKTLSPTLGRVTVIEAGKINNQRPALWGALVLHRKKFWAATFNKSGMLSLKQLSG